jgi:hypothetical protein
LFSIQIHTTWVYVGAVAVVAVAPHAAVAEAMAAVGVVCGVGPAGSWVLAVHPAKANAEANTAAAIAVNRGRRNGIELNSWSIGSPSGSPLSTLGERI